MVFVPVSTPPTVLSTRSRALSAQLDETIEAYRRQHPETSPAEVAQALAAITASHKARAPQARAAVVGVAAMLVAGIGVFVALASNDGTIPSVAGTPMVVIGIGVGAVLVALLVKLRRSGEE
jgi:acyl-CoA synthetase (NDP forming)